MTLIRTIVAPDYDLSDTGMAPRGLRVFSLNRAEIIVPESARMIPAAVIQQTNGRDQPAPIGHNSTRAQPMLEEDDRATQRVRAIAEIRDWLANRRGRPADYMSATEIAAAENRLILLKRALVDGAAYIRRALDALDPDPDRRGTSLVIYVYLYDCLFSDNDEGCSTASNTRYAKLLGVGERAIRYARNLLVELHALVCTRRGGLENCYWPVINRRLTGDYVHLTWWLDATSDPINRGRTPEKPRHTRDRGLGEENPGTDAQTPARYVPDPKETPARIAITPARPFGQPIENKGNARLDFTNKNSLTDSLGAGAPADATLPLEEADRLPPKRAGGKQSKKGPPPEAMEAYRLYIEVAERLGLSKPNPTPKLLAVLAAVLKAQGGLDAWRRVLARIEAIPALHGIGDGFSMKASLFWLTKDAGENVNKVLSGECDNWGRRRSPPSSGGGVF